MYNTVIKMQKRCVEAIAVVAMLVSIWSCQQVEEVFEDRKTRENKAEIRAYLAQKGIQADSLRTGLYYYIQNLNPSAQKPQVGDEITLKYVARRLDGVIVDSTLSALPYMYIRSYASRDLSSFVFRFNPVPSFEDLMLAPVEKIREGDKVSLFVPWSLRSTKSVNLLTPLYIPLRYDIEILKVRSEEEQIEDFIKTNGITNMERDATTGLRFLRTRTYTDSTQIKAGDEVKVTYTGKLISNGTQFDSGTLSVGVVDPNGNAKGSVVKGFNDAIIKLKYGEKAIAIFPSVLGYGVNGSGAKIPAYAPLYFEIEVTKK